MKKIVFAVCFVVSILLVSVPVLAKGVGVSAPANSVMNNETAKIGTLYIKTLDSEARAFIDDYMSSSNDYHVTFGNYTVDFIKWETNLKTALNFNGKDFSFKVPAVAKMVSFDIFTGEPVNGTLETYTATVGTMYGFNFVGYNPFITAGYDLTNYDYVWKPVSDSADGKYTVVFDDGDGQNNGGIIEWLKNFWDNLLKFFKDLFVPPDGYFENWFKEIQTAFTEKLGGVGNLFESISKSFESIKDSQKNKSEIMIELPDNYLFDGFKGFSTNLISKQGYSLLSWLRNVITAIIIVITAVTCIRKVIALTHR